MLRAAEARFERAGLRFQAGEAERLPFADASLDGVAATSVVGLLDDATAFLHEVGRVLRPGGTSVITFTNRQSVLHALGSRRRRSPLRLPVRSYSTREAVLELEAAGLAVAEIRYYNCFLASGRFMLPPRALALLLERILNRRGGR